ncbi:unnamed protein product [Rodentolepis nana]|uniref:Dirigent protein n=1 Tax=Rodentolepis nana TaxID=102285 RepID=A0A0R3TV39_RODNA|nr:unnamed protein product [Rodentolepis nana]
MTGDTWNEYGGKQRTLRQEDANSAPIPVVIGGAVGLNLSGGNYRGPRANGALSRHVEDITTGNLARSSCMSENVAEKSRNSHLGSAQAQPLMFPPATAFPPTNGGHFLSPFTNPLCFPPTGFVVSSLPPPPLGSTFQPKQLPGFPSLGNESFVEDQEQEIHIILLPIPCFQRTISGVVARVARVTRVAEVAEATEATEVALLTAGIIIVAVIADVPSQPFLPGRPRMPRNHPHVRNERQQLMIQKDVEEEEEMESGPIERVIAVVIMVDHLHHEAVSTAVVDISVKQRRSFLGVFQMFPLSQHFNVVTVLFRTIPIQIVSSLSIPSPLCPTLHHSAPLCTVSQCSVLPLLMVINVAQVDTCHLHMCSGTSAFEGGKWYAGFSGFGSSCLVTSLQHSIDGCIEVVIRKTRAISFQTNHYSLKSTASYGLFYNIRVYVVHGPPRGGTRNPSMLISTLVYTPRPIPPPNLYLNPNSNGETADTLYTEGDNEEQRG